MSNIENNMTRQDTVRLYDKLEEIVKMISALQTGLALMQQTQNLAEKAANDLNAHMALHEARLNLIEKFHGKLKTYGAIAGILGYFILDMLKDKVTDFFNSPIAETAINTITKIG